MLPIRDENHEITTFPFITYGLITLNVLAFIYELTLSDNGLNRFLMEYGAVPAKIMVGNDLHALFSSMFLHAGWGHIIGNMLFLKVFGDNVEDQMGHWWFLAFYLITGLAASGAHILLNQGSTVPSVGASGAISGVLGAYIVSFPKNRVMVWVFFSLIAVPAWLMIGFWAAEQFLATVGTVARTEQTTGGIAYAAHAGGFIAGVVLGLIAKGVSGRSNASRSTSKRYY
ncbi:MAG: rhomboid family intramembrane serine protease [Ignavibacteriae bacterium]|nr:rhomboid family intramembrane serine protease [Ignavibacteriota bacterium]MCB9214978.1 rhomboid family intramembrane serine protease [Ignavibacteria bacterium]